MRDITSQLRRRLERIERRHAEKQYDDERPLLTFDQAYALPEDSPLHGLDENGLMRYRLDWDSLCSTHLPEHDPSTVADPIGDRLRALEAEFAAPAVPCEAAPKNGFVEAPTVPTTTGE